MKNLMILAVIVFAGMTMTHANTAIDNNIVAVADSVERTLIEPADLPEAVQETLSGEAYTGLVIVTAYHVQPATGNIYYEISLQRQGEENLRVVLLNEDGTIRESTE